ncbi:MAG: TetR family transcriptional regulator [Proteobacteria bacterium]|nr:TetR family transcriptional regulator [Pseudomonadota bacterium]
MHDEEFDRALIGAWFALAADGGRHLPSVAAAAQEAGLPVERARARFPGRESVLMRFGRLADQAALTGMMSDGSVRDRLFDATMRRVDQLQAHRAGVLAVLRHLPANPPLALLLACATERSMRWLLDAAGARTAGLTGMARVKGMVGVWLWTLRAWERDESADLSPTMAALDRALAQAERAAGYLPGTGGRRRATEAAPESPPSPEPPPPAAPPEPPAPEPGSPADGMPGLEPNA